MRNRGFSAEHEEAVARRLAALSAEWESAKTQGSGGWAEPEPPALAPAGSRPALPGSALQDQAWPWEPHTQVRGAVVASPEPTSSPEQTAGPAPMASPSGPQWEEAALRLPGRHAARRGVPGLVARMAGRRPSLALGERIGLQVAHLTWIAVIAAVALAATSWWLVRAKEQSVLAPVAVSTGSSAAASSSATPTGPPSPTAPSSATGAASAAPAAAEVVVDVAGKVRRPGIVVLPQGSRVVDALEAAGGARRGVDLKPLNLARVLVDGEQILVGVAAGPAIAGAAPAPGVPGASAGSLVNLNVASVTDLETLPGVGPVTASAIVEWRTRHGGFTSVEDLLEVQGIGEVTLERLAPLVTI